MAFEVTRALLGSPELGSKTFDLGYGTEYIVPLYDAPVGESRWMPRFGGASVKDFITPGQKIPNPRERFDALAPWDQESIFNQYGVSSYDDLVQNIENVRAMPGPTPTRPIIEQDLNALMDVYSQDQRISESNLRSLEQDYAEAPDLEPPQSYFDELREWNRNYQTEQENALWGSDEELLRQLEVKQRQNVMPSGWDEFYTDPTPETMTGKALNEWLSRGGTLQSNTPSGIPGQPSEWRGITGEDVIPIGESPLGEEPIHRSLEALNPLQWTGPPTIPPVEMSGSGRLASMARFPLAGAVGLAAALYSPEAGAGSDIVPLEGIFPGGQPELLPEQPVLRGEFGYKPSPVDVNLRDQLAQWYEQAYIDPTKYGLEPTPVADVLSAARGLEEFIQPGQTTNLSDDRHKWRQLVERNEQIQGLPTTPEQWDSELQSHDVREHLDAVFGGGQEETKSPYEGLMRKLGSAGLKSLPEKVRDWELSRRDSDKVLGGSIEDAQQAPSAGAFAAVTDTLKDRINNEVFKSIRDTELFEDLSRDEKKEIAYNNPNIVQHQNQVSALATMMIDHGKTVESLNEDMVELTTQVESFADIPETPGVFEEYVAPDVEDFSAIRDRAAEVAGERDREAQEKADERDRKAEKAARDRSIAKAASASRKAEAKREAAVKKAAQKQRDKLDAASKKALQDHMAWMATQTERLEKERKKREKYTGGVGGGLMYT